jgi:hypothetical protein
MAPLFLFSAAPPLCILSRLAFSPTLVHTFPRSNAFMRHLLLATVVFFAASTSTPAQSLEIPAGTILSARLNQALSSKYSKPGQPISARIMQDVPLLNHNKIPAGAKLRGTILAVTNVPSASISLRFDSLEWHRQQIPLHTSLRALANFMEVQSAQTPETAPGFGDPFSWMNTRQIGGDEVYGVGGPVTDGSNNRVGHAVNGGVLVHVRAHPDSKCRGPLNAEDDRLQALWVFSSDACGVYGIDGLTIAHAGRSSPPGEITLTAGHRDVLVRNASAILLRVLR